MKKLVVVLAFSMLLFFGCKHSNSNAFDHVNLTHFLDSAEKYSSTTPKQAQTYLDSIYLPSFATKDLRFLAIQARVNSEQNKYAENIHLLEPRIHSFLPEKLDSQQTKYLAKINYALALAYYNRKEYAKSLDYTTKSLSLLKNSADVNPGNLYVMLGGISKKLKNFDSSIDYLKKSVSYNKQPGRMPALASSYLNLSATFLLMEEPDSCLFYVERAIELKKVINDTSGLVKALSNKAEVLKELNRIQEAILIQRNLMRLDHFDHPVAKGISCVSLADLYQHQHLLDSSVKYLKKANYIVQIYDDKELALLTKKVYISYYLKLNKTDSAILFMNQAFDINDSLHFLSNNMLVSNIDERINNLNAQYQNKIDIVEARVQEQNQRLLIYQLIIGILLSLGLTLILTRTLKRKKEKLRQKEAENFNLSYSLKHEKEEKEEGIKQVARLGETISSHYDAFKKIKKELRKFKTKGEMDISALETLIYSSTDDLKSVEVFQYYLQQVQSGLYQKLKLKFNALTNTELQLCGLLMLDMSSKQIATLLNVETKSIEVYRYRLRKKFSLDPHQNLSEFIKNQSD